MIKSHYICYSLLLVLLSIKSFSSCTAHDDVLIDNNTDTDTFNAIIIPVFGDIQYYTNTNHISLYKHSLEWIEKKYREGWKINCILHTGDITQSNLPSQYNLFYQAVIDLTNEIPLYTIIGNHDYSWENRKITDRNSTHFNDYVHFPLSTKKVVAWFEEGHMENIVVDNNIYGQNYDLLFLEFGPREEVVKWANEYVKNNIDHNFILLTHEYLEKGGGRRTRNLSCEILLDGMNFLTPEQLWNNLIKCNDNIRLVLCGHVGGLFAITYDVNDFGRIVPQIQHNIQSPEYRYDNWLMLLEFPFLGDSARVYIYNTNTEKYFEGKDTLLKFKYRN